MNRMVWTEEADAILRAGVDAKLSAKEIAEQLGAPATVRSVFNRMRRLGLRMDEAAWRARCGHYARSPETRQAVREANIRRFSDPAERQKVSARFKALFADPDYAEANRQKIIAYCATPEGRAQRARSARLAHAAKLTGLRREYWPLYRELKRTVGRRAERLEMCLAQQARDDSRRQREAAEQMRARMEAMRTGGGRARISPVLEAAPC